MGQPVAPFHSGSSARHVVCRTGEKPRVSSTQSGFLQLRPPPSRLHPLTIHKSCPWTRFAASLDHGSTSQVPRTATGSSRAARQYESGSEAPIATRRNHDIAGFRFSEQFSAFWAFREENGPGHTSFDEYVVER